MGQEVDHRRQMRETPPPEASNSHLIPSSARNIEEFEGSYAVSNHPPKEMLLKSASIVLGASGSLKSAALIGKHVEKLQAELWREQLKRD